LGVTTDRQTLLSTFNSGGNNYVLEAYGQQVNGTAEGGGVVWGLAAEETDWENYYSVNLNDNLNASPPNLFLYSWVANSGPYATATLGSDGVGTVNPNTWYQLMMKVYPPNFGVYFNGALQFTGNDSNLTTGGVGLYGEGNTQA
jgi:hypothetical protein